MKKLIYTILILLVLGGIGYYFQEDIKDLIASDPCKELVCEHAGLATPSDDGKTCSCACTQGFQGSRCEEIDITKLQVLLDDGMTPKTLIDKGVALKYFYGKIYQRGVIFELKADGTGMVAASKDADKKMKWNDAIKYCEDLKLEGYEDWVLPSKDTLNLMYLHLQKNGLGGFVADFYWSSTEGSNGAWSQKVHYDGFQVNVKKETSNLVRAARAF